MVIIPEDKFGVLKTLDAGIELLEKHNDLRQALVDYDTVKKQGDVLLGYPAYFSVVSRDSREECLKLAQKIPEEFKYDIE